MATTKFISERNLRFLLYEVFDLESLGDHDGVDNVVHLMLAKIEGAPAGVKGISLFVVPKLIPGAEDRLVPNDVTVFFLL
jgi:hypothetical protein